jgi:hypothetical protein
MVFCTDFSLAVIAAGGRSPQPFDSGGLAAAVAQGGLFDSGDLASLSDFGGFPVAVRLGTLVPSSAGAGSSTVPRTEGAGQGGTCGLSSPRIRFGQKR